MLIRGKAREGEASRFIVLDDDTSWRTRAEDVLIIKIENVGVGIDYHVNSCADAAVGEFYGRQEIF